MQDLLFFLISFFQTVFATMFKIVFCAILSSMFFLIVKLYARRGVRGAKEKDWSSAKQAFVISFWALFILAFLELVGFFEFLFEVLFGGFV